MSETWRGLLLIIVFLAGCVFESGPELPQLPPFSPPNNANNTNNTNFDAGDMADTGDMTVADMPVDMIEPDMPDEPDMPADMYVAPDLPPDMSDEPDMMPLPGPYGDVCPGAFDPAPAPPSCDLVLQNCTLANFHCDLAIVGNNPNNPPTFEPRCILDEIADFTLMEGQTCDPGSSTVKCRKGLECSQIGGENRCRRFCILEDARGCDPMMATSSCAPTGVGPLDSNGIGFCANSCDAF